MGPGETRTITRPGVLTGRINVNAGGKLSIKGTSLRFSGKDTMIYVDKGILELEGSYIKATDTCNCLIYIDSGTHVFTVNNCKFDGAGKAGILFTWANMNSINGCQFTNIFGRAIFEMGSGQLQLKDTLFTHCNQEGDGAAIYGGRSYVILENCKFIECKANGKGGALTTSKLKASGCYFSYCSSSNGGGAIYSDYAGKDHIELNNCTFNNCSSRSGGGIYIGSNLYRIGVDSENCTFSDCIPNNIEIKGG